MKFVFLGCFLPDPIYSDIVSNSKRSVSNAADALQKSFIEGLSEVLDNLSIINFPSIGMWPRAYKQLFFHEYNYTYLTYKGKKIPCHNPAFLNLYMYCRHDIYLKMKSTIGKIIKHGDDTVCVFVYAILPWTMHACFKIKEKYGNRVRFVLIAPDLPEYQGVRKYYIQDLLLKRRQRSYKTFYNAFDGFILLTRYMAERLPVGKKPWVVVEGIYNLKDDNYFPERNENKAKTIFYSGTLDERFGIMNLINAFCKTSNPDYRLVLCGMGNTVDKIKARALQDSRIKYLGQLSRSEVLKNQKKATVLVNPRTPEGEFTKFSFPSKTMEYFASGIPSLLYSLPGIPEEYLQYCFHIEELGVDALYNKIEELMALDVSILEEMGARARNYVIENKNPYVQCAKINAILKDWS